jgi:hypothetical protein
MSATVGIIIAVTGGIFYINIAARKGYCTRLDKSEGIPQYKKKGLIPAKQRYSIAKATVASESIEPMAFHFAVTVLAILIGWLLLAGVRQIHPVLGGFPPFSPGHDRRNDRYRLYRHARKLTSTTTGTALSGFSVFPWMFLLWRPLHQFAWICSLKTFGPSSS